MENKEVARQGWPRNRKLVTWGLVAGLVLSMGGATAAIAVSNYTAETKRLCTASVTAYDAVVTGGVANAKAEAKTALGGSRDAAIRKALPGASAYSVRAEVKADAKKKLEARPAAKNLIAAVQERSDALAEVKGKAVCDSREDAKTLTKDAKTLTADAEALAGAVQKLNADVSSFKASEKKRIAAEKKAAAEQAAAEQAAAEAAAAQAAEQAAADTYYEPPTYSDNSGGGGNTWTPPPAPDPGTGGGGGGWAPPPPPGGGGDCPSTMNCHV